MENQIGKTPVYAVKYKDHVDYDDKHKRFLYTVSELLEIINDPDCHSAEWIDYDETDWKEGLEEFSDYELINPDPIYYI